MRRNRSRARKRKRKRIAEAEDEARRRKLLHSTSNSSSEILRSFQRSSCIRNIILILCAVVLTQFDYLIKIPAPIVPDYRFHPSFCGTERTQGLSAEALFRFDEDQLYTLVVQLGLPEVMRTYARDKF